MANNFHNLNITSHNSGNSQIAKTFAIPQYSQKPQVENEEEQQYFDSEYREDSANQTRLNGLDSTLLEKEAYQDIEDEDFKSEYKINKLEEQLAAIENDIENAKRINDTQKIDILIMRKHSIQNQLNNLKHSYGENDIATKLSDDITNILTNRPKGISKFTKSINNILSNKILAKISKSFNSNLTVKNALLQLKTLNKNVDELVTMQTPYGEADEWYDKLSDYLNTANVIHFQISKTVGTPTFFDTISSIDKEKLKQGVKNSSNFGNMTSKKDKK